MPKPATIDVQTALRGLTREWGPWTCSPIDLGDGVATVDADQAAQRSPILVKNVVQQFRDALRRPLAGLRLLDLASLEGNYTIELAKHGAHCLGVEARIANLMKAKFVARQLGLAEAQFVQDDVRNVTREKYGMFDGILCSGILYHLDVPDVFHFLRNICAMCSGVILIDTHVSLQAEVETSYDKRSYSGWFYKEHDEHTTLQQREDLVWSSIDNCRSFWFTKPSLINCLEEFGCTSILENLTPGQANRAPDRITLMAFPGRRVPYLCASSAGHDLYPKWGEADQKFWVHQALQHSWRTSYQGHHAAGVGAIPCQSTTAASEATAEHRAGGSA